MTDLRLPPLPWRLERTKNTATVYDARNQPVIGMCDIELGWTDTATGPYVDPEGCWEEISAIVETMNALPKIAGGFRSLMSLILTPAERATICDIRANAEPTGEEDARSRSALRREQRRLLDIIDRLTGQQPPA